MNLSFQSVEVGFSNTLCHLDGLSFEGPGLTALVGANGAGKSTLLRTIAGLHDPRAGKIIWDDQDLSLLTPAERSQILSIVLTERIALGGLTVQDIVAMGRHPFGRQPGDEDQISKAMHTLGISHLGSRAMDSISDGERQKTVIARAICQDTPLLILDEPTAFLDFKARMQLFEVLRDLAKKKRVIFSSHDLRALTEVPCDLLVCEKEVRYFPEAHTPDHLLEMIRMFSPTSAERR